ncbi:hypothetical protein QTN47_27210 [Danxiaibacter flavus]|uniref:DUF3298 domain-containing protein n=1 Tax=Danxiaibacter flavus TaxID=3049108 RepID=A0ABV3ZN54_9BACT|nr:hypothetical protein QNM32_27210 [Chitinophagaceae bacterium DXS]
MSRKYLPPVHLACGDDEMRPALMYVEILDGIATATNGYMICRLNLSEYSNLDETTLQQLSGMYIHRDAWNLICDAEIITLSDEYDNTLTYVKGGVEANIQIKGDNEVKYPDYQSLINKIANSRFDKKSFIGFDPKWIEISKKIFQSKTIIIRFYEQESMFTIFPGNDSKAFIGIMPMVLKEEDAVIDFSLS